MSHKFSVVQLLGYKLPLPTFWFGATFYAITSYQDKCYVVNYINDASLLHIVDPFTFSQTSHQLPPPIKSVHNIYIDSDYVLLAGFRSESLYLLDHKYNLLATIPVPGSQPIDCAIVDNTIVYIDYLNGSLLQVDFPSFPAININYAFDPVCSFTRLLLQPTHTTHQPHSFCIIDSTYVILYKYPSPSLLFFDITTSTNYRLDPNEDWFSISPMLNGDILLVSNTSGLHVFSTDTFSVYPLFLHPYFTNAISFDKHILAIFEFGPFLCRLD